MESSETSPANNPRRSGYDLTRGPVGLQLRRQAIPFSFALLAIFSFEAIDLLFIAQLGDAPLAAIGFVLPVIWLVYGVGIGLEAGVASCVSRAVGRGQEEKARRLTTDSGVLGVLVATIIIAIGLPLIDPVFRLLGATDELMPMIRSYMSVWYFVAPADMVLWTSLAAIRARGNTLLESKIIIGAAVLNLIFDPILIFGLFGVPAMGVAGAALATLLATVIMLAFSLWYLGFRLQVFAPLTARIRTLWASWAHMLEIGIPAIGTNAIVPLSSAIVVYLVADFGVDAVAGFGIAMRIEPIALIPFYALSAVSSPFFGQNLGGNHFPRLHEAQRVVTKFCVIYGLALAVVVSVAAPLLAGWYSDSAAIRNVAIHYLWIVAWSWGAYGLVMSVNASFNGSGRPLPAVVLSVSRVILVLLPLIALGLWVADLHGLFAAIALSNLVVGVGAWFWLRRHINQMAEHPMPTETEPTA